MHYKAEARVRCVVEEHFQLVDVISMSIFAGYESPNTTLNLVNLG